MEFALRFPSNSGVALKSVISDEGDLVVDNPKNKQTNKQNTRIHKRCSYIAIKSSVRYRLYEISDFQKVHR